MDPFREGKFGALVRWNGGSWGLAERCVLLQYKGEAWRNSHILAYHRLSCEVDSHASNPQLDNHYNFVNFLQMQRLLCHSPATVHDHPLNCFALTTRLERTFGKLVLGFPAMHACPYALLICLFVLLCNSMHLLLIPPTSALHLGKLARMYGLAFGSHEIGLFGHVIEGEEGMPNH